MQLGNLSEEEVSKGMMRWIEPRFLLLLGAIGGCTRSLPVAAPPLVTSPPPVISPPVAQEPDNFALVPCKGHPATAPRLRLIDCTERRDHPFLQPTEPCDPELLWALEVDNSAYDAPRALSLHARQDGRVTLVARVRQMANGEPCPPALLQTLAWTTLDMSGQTTATRFLGSPSIAWDPTVTEQRGAQLLLTRRLYAPRPYTLPAALDKSPMLLAVVDLEGNIQRFVPDPLPTIEYPGRELALRIASDHLDGAYAMRVSKHEGNTQRLALSYLPLSASGVPQSIVSVDLFPHDRRTPLHAFVVPEIEGVAVVGTFSGRFGEPLHLESSQALFVARFERGGRLLEATQVGSPGVEVGSVFGLGPAGSKRIAMTGRLSNTWTIGGHVLSPRSDCVVPRGACENQPTVFVRVLASTSGNSWARTFPELSFVRAIPGPDMGLTALGVVKGGGARVMVLDSSGNPRWQREFSRLEVDRAVWSDDGFLLLLVYDRHHRTSAILAFKPALAPGR